MAEVKIPGIGNVDQKWVWVGGALVVGVVGYAYIRQSRAASDDAIDDMDTDDYTTDEYPYGEAFATDYAYDGGYPSYGGGYYPPPPVSGDPFQERDPINDMEWVARVIEYLQSLGVDGQTASLAVSKYRLKECLTGAQADIVRQAVGRWSVPPQSPNLTIIVCTTPPPGAPPPPTGGTPSSVLPAPGGLHPTTVTRSSIRMAWSPVNGAVKYNVYIYGTTTLGKVGTVTSTTFTKSGIKPNRYVTFRVAAVDSTGKVGAMSSQSRVKTRK